MRKLFKIGVKIYEFQNHYHFIDVRDTHDASIKTLVDIRTIALCTSLNNAKVALYDYFTTTDIYTKYIDDTVDDLFLNRQISIFGFETDKDRMRIDIANKSLKSSIRTDIVNEFKDKFMVAPIDVINSLLGSDSLPTSLKKSVLISSKFWMNIDLERNQIRVIS